MGQLSTGVSKALAGATALLLTFGAVAFGRDLQQRAPDQLNVAAASDISVNRSGKTDRAARATIPVTRAETVSVRLNDLANTSVLIRLPLTRESLDAATVSPQKNSGAGHVAVACEPSVSVLTDIAKRLQPGRCVT